MRRPRLGTPGGAGAGPAPRSRPDAPRRCPRAPGANRGRGARAGAAARPDANRLSEGQARSRIEETGCAPLTGLRPDGRGIRRGRAMRNGQPVDVALDRRGQDHAARPSGTAGAALSPDGRAR
ncbi:hypothetical protein GCM10010964_23180 [Caldovatus sediminis]|uniref:Uncharacterized protein n=1 Tax=Caldovatus sediminis TaxID=2041189 RepID=A0A8J3ECD9_9PROT|nr:hypothetical protein GCM10010964_23180 [Caldovatus sediminis]